MKYLLKLAGNGYFEEVNKYTFDNYKFAIADDGTSPRYVPNCWVMLNDDGTISMQLSGAPAQDMAILMRGLDLPHAPPRVDGGFIREPTMVKFHKGKTISILEVKTGVVYRSSIAA